jgi:ferredoxin
MHSRHGSDGCMSGDLGVELVIDRITCDGSGLCAELLPEIVTLDDWGYPIIRPGTVPPQLMGLARRAVADCPVLALRLETVERTPPARPRVS